MVSDLQLGSVLDKAQCLFEFMGLINYAAEQGAGADHTVWCMAAKEPFHLSEKAKAEANACTLFLQYNKGDKIITLDPPFPLYMEEGSGLKLDDINGIKVAYGIHYSPGGDQGIQFHKSGLVWWQHMTHQVHAMHLGALSGLFTKTVKTLSGKIAMLKQQKQHQKSSIAEGKASCSVAIVCRK